MQNIPQPSYYNLFKSNYFHTGIYFLYSYIEYIL